MALHATREGPIGTANAWANLTTFGGSTLNTVQVPAGYQSIKELYVMHQINGAATDTTGCVVLGRLKGDAIVNGPQDFVIGAWGNEQTGNSSIAGVTSPLRIPVDIAIKPNSNFWMQGMQFTDSDAGTPEVQIEAVMTKAPSQGNLYRVRNVSAGAGAFAVDTKYQLTNEAETTSVGTLAVPSGYNGIDLITAAFGGLTIATAAGGTTFGRIEGDLPEGEQAFGISGLAGLSTGTGVTDAFAPATVIPTALKVKDSGSLRLYMEQTGTAEPTTAQMAIGLGFTRNVGTPMTYIHREGPLNTTGDIDALITTQGSIAAPGSIIVPAGKSRISQVITCFGDNTPTGADKNAGIVARFGGNGLVEGEQMINVGGTFAVFTTAGDSGFGQWPAYVRNVDWPVTTGGVITIGGQQVLGVDIGVPELGVTLGFQ